MSEYPPRLNPLAVLVAVMGGQTAFAALCNVGRTTVWRWLNGITTPTELEQKAINNLAFKRGLKMPYPKRFKKAGVDQ